MLQESQTLERGAVFAPSAELAPAQPAGATWKVEAASRAEIEAEPRWADALAGDRKDRRYYEIVEDAILQGFDYRYFVLKDEAGKVRAIQPFFINDQDLVAGASQGIQKVISSARRVWPRFLKMRTLMVGCAAGEGHLDAQDAASRAAVARSLASGIGKQARQLKSKLIVFKEFTRTDRAALTCLSERGFARAPSMPMTRLRLNFASIEDYLRNVLSRNMRSKLRRKFKESEKIASLEMRMVTDITPYIDEVYPLYMAVYEKSNLHFEKLTPDYFVKLGLSMPDKVRYFLWLRDGKVVCFNLCMAHNDAVVSEYIGFDYSVAFDLHLYYIAVRDVMKWALDNRYQWYCSTALNYEPKFHLKHELDPLDLYVKHTSPVVNFFMKRALPYMEPTRYDKLLKLFPNYDDLNAAA
jgi:predicted N-acyltransferase